MRGEHDASLGLATAADERLERHIADMSTEVQKLIERGRHEQAKALARNLAALVAQRSPQQITRMARVIMLENVEEFQDWGPLCDRGFPIKEKAGTTFRLWLNQLRAAGYKVEHRELRACDFGAPTIRKRLFVIARRDGLPILWPKPTHGARLLPYRTAAECIDWSIPCPSIFDRKRPLAENTLRRIARGVMKYVVNCADPFIVPVTHQGDDRVHSINEPMRTITTAQRGEFALVSPTLISAGYGERPGQAPRVPGLDKPLGTVVAGGGKHALVAAFLAQHNGGMVGHDLRKPISTLTGKCSQQQVVTAIINHARTSNAAGGNGDVRQPMRTIVAGGTHHALVKAFLLKFYGTDQDPRLTDPLHTVTTRDRFALVTVGGEEYAIVDIGMRMLQPRELYRAQSFPDAYVIDFEHEGRPLPKASQVRMCGNSVPPLMARALVEANFAHEAQWRDAA